MKKKLLALVVASVMIFTVANVGQASAYQYSQQQIINAIERHPSFDRGERGPEVAAIQIKLRSSVFSDGTLAVDGIYGPATERVLIRYKQYNGLPANGHVGHRVWEKMYKFCWYYNSCGDYI